MTDPTTTATTATTRHRRTAARRAPSTTSAIADYEGPRLGRGHAIRSLFTHSLRSSFGIGRGGRAKVAPIILGAIALIPAIAIVGGD